MHLIHRLIEKGKGEDMGMMQNMRALDKFKGVGQNRLEGIFNAALEHGIPETDVHIYMDNKGKIFFQKKRGGIIPTCRLLRRIAKGGGYQYYVGLEDY